MGCSRWQTGKQHGLDCSQEDRVMCSGSGIYYNTNEEKTKRLSIITGR